MRDLVLGLDIGGSSSRALVTTVDGQRVGYGRAGGGNPVTVPLETASANVSAALSQALSNVDPTAIRAAVVGAAGSAGFETLKPILASLPCPVRIVGDVVVAFAAGSEQPGGTVLISGTGAVAARIDGLEVVQVADGLGPLLGDLGSGFWIGRAAAAHAARQLQAGEPDDLTQLITEEADSDAFVISVHGQPVGALSRLAPLVSQAAEAGDRVALSIVDDAASLLVSTLAQIRPPTDASPIVLSGSVLLSETVRARVTARLATRWPGASISAAGAGEVGAARLAAELAKADGCA